MTIAETPSPGSLRAYIESFPPKQRDRRRAALAKRCGITPEYLYIVELGHRRASPALARRLDEETDGKVQRHVERGDIFDPPAQSVPA